MVIATSFARRLFLGLLLGLGLGHPAYADPDCPPAAVELTMQQLVAGLAKARDRGFLWHITKDGRSSYLYGTIHVAKLEWMAPGPTVVAALGESDILALEMDLLDPQIQQGLAAGLAAPSSTAVPTALTERVRRRLALECIEPAAMAKIAPELQVEFLATLAGRRDGLDPSYGVDAALAALGHASHKRVISLETPAEQLLALRMPAAAETIVTMGSTLDELESGRSTPLLLRIAEVWASADLAELARYEEWCECRRTAIERRAMQRLIDDRNVGLAERIDALHAAGSKVFAAVGSLHMVGPAGLPALLERRGYRVEARPFRP